MKKKLLFILIPLASLLIAPVLGNDVSVSSKEATYDGDNLILDGSVSLEHGLGTLFAEKAFLQKQGENAELPFSAIELKKDVHIVLKNKAELSSETAELDFILMKGKLTSKENERVIFTDILKEASIRMLSKEADILFIKKNEGTTSLEYAIKNFIAKENVFIEYSKDFTLQADEASYEMEGLIKAYPTLANSTCELSYCGGIIKTSFIELNIEKNLLFLKNPNGLLNSSLFSEDKSGQIFFSCKDLNWDHAKETLILQNDVVIKESDFGTLSASKEMIIIQEQIDGKNFIKSIHIDGPSLLSNKTGSLTCLGFLHVDGPKGQVTALSPSKKGQTTPENQLTYITSDMILKADKAFLEYAESSYELISLVLKNKVTIQTLDKTKPRKLALADKLTYAPDTMTIILSANPGKKVLFLDEEQGVTMSAQEVHLTQNIETKKTEIKGIGNMKLSLSQEEYAILKNHFPNTEAPELSHD